MKTVTKKVGRPVGSYKPSESLQVLALKTMLEDEQYRVKTLEHEAVLSNAVIDYLERKLQREMLK